MKLTTLFSIIGFLYCFAHGTNSLSPPILSVTWQGGDHLSFTIGPPLEATGITGYTLIRTDVNAKKATIVSGVADPPRTQGTYMPTACFDGEYTASWSMCCTNTEAVGVLYKFTVETPALFDHVKITRKTGKLDAMINFDMKYKDEDNAWHNCPGTPYHYPESDGIGPKAFACKSPVPAKQIQLISKHKTSMCIMEVEIYVSSTLGTYSIGPQSEYALNETGIGTREAD
jgi:hypothetical protein